jgi:hypothetical protein
MSSNPSAILTKRSRAGWLVGVAALIFVASIFTSPVEFKVLNPRTMRPEFTFTQDDVLIALALLAALDCVLLIHAIVRRRLRKMPALVGITLCVLAAWGNISGVVTSSRLRHALIEKENKRGPSK